MSDDDKPLGPRESDYADIRWDGTEDVFDSTAGRWWMVFILALVLSGIQIFLAPVDDAFRSTTDVKWSLLIFTAIGHLSLIAWGATIGLAICWTARWIWREPLRTLFRD